MNKLIHVLSIQEYDSPDIILYSNQDARDAHKAWAEIEYPDYHIETYTLDVHDTFDPSDRK